MLTYSSYPLHSVSPHGQGRAIVQQASAITVFGGETTVGPPYWVNKALSICHHCTAASDNHHGSYGSSDGSTNKPTMPGDQPMSTTPPVIPRR